MKYIVNIDKRVRLLDNEKFCSFPVFTKFLGDFNEENVSKFCSQLIEVEHAASDAEQEIIPISVDSNGGDVYALLNLVDTLEDLKTRFKVATIIEGKAMSAGAVLFTCGTEGYRFMAPNSTLMIHNASGGVKGNPHDVQITAKEMERLNCKIFELMAQNCSKKKDYFLDLINDNRHSDLFLDAETCKKHNLTNHIGLPRFEVAVTLQQKFVY
jgi:ATP-dependent Clp protease protease subunit